MEHPVVDVYAVVAVYAVVVYAVVDVYALVVVYDVVAEEKVEFICPHYCGKHNTS